MVQSQFLRISRMIASRPSLLPILIIIAGAAERMAWLALQGRSLFATGETANAAIAFARTGEIADIFAKGSGPSAHLNPLLPMIAGSIYRVFGIRSLASEFLLATMSISLALASAWFMYRIFGLLEAPRRTRLIALALFCLAPFNLQAEAVTFRVWEGALAAALGGATLLLIIKSDKDRAIGWPRVALLSLLAALLFFINPAYGIAIYGAAAILCVRRISLKHWLGVILTAALALMIVLTPWIIRNAVVFDRFIPLRSNMGLELALANHPAAAIGKPDDYTVFRQRLDAIHPLQNGEGFERMMRAGGEIAYADALGKEARQWIADHPTAFVRLCVKHLRQFYFPPRWQWTIYSKDSRGTTAKMLTTWLVSALGLTGVILALLSRQGLWLYAACVTLLPSLPYIITQPVPRYRYLVFAPMLFFAVFFADWCVRQIHSRFGATPAQDMKDRPTASSHAAPS